MKNLQNLAAACEADLRSIGIRPGRVSAWRVDTRAKSRWGQCRELTPGCFEISIAARLLQDDVSDQAAKDTILHELLHTVRGCHGHTGRWAELAAQVNRLLPQYTIKRTKPCRACAKAAICSAASAAAGSSAASGRAGSFSTRSVTAAPAAAHWSACDKAAPTACTKRPNGGEAAASPPVLY